MLYLTYIENPNILNTFALIKMTQNNTLLEALRKITGLGNSNPGKVYK